MKRLIYDINKSITIPEAVDEFTGKQLIAIAHIICTEKNRLTGSLKALKVLSKLNFFQFLFLSAEAEYNCIEHVQFVFEEMKLTRQLIPKYKNYYGPKNELENFTLAEFFFSEIYYAELITSSSQNMASDEGALNKLIAVLYRRAKRNYNIPLDKDGDIRMEFNANVVNYYADRIRHWPSGVKQAILIFYDGCREKIKDDNEDIFSAGSGEDSAGMYGIMRGLAGPKFGEMEKVEKMYLHTALMEINLIIKEEAKIPKTT